MEPCHTMEPPPARFMYGSAALVSRAWPLMLTAALRSQSSAVAVSTLWKMKLRGNEAERGCEQARHANGAAR